MNHTFYSIKIFFSQEEDTDPNDHTRDDVNKSIEHLVTIHKDYDVLVAFRQPQLLDLDVEIAETQLFWRPVK